MARITQADLEATARRLNDMTGNPATPWTKTGDRYVANIGNFHISGAYGGVALHQMVSEGGGVRDLFGGHMPKRELYERMHAYIRGICDAKK